MASNYTGNPTAVQAPATAPAVNNPVVISIPAGTDVRTIESITQALKVEADNTTFLLNIAGATTTAKGLSIDATGGTASPNIGAGHIRITGGTPTIATGSGSGFLGSGTGATASVVAGSSDVRGQINLTTGTGPSGSNASVWSVTFGNAWTGVTPMVVLLYPASTTTAGLAPTMLYVSSTSSTTWSTATGAAALTASTSYSWFYLVIG